MRITLTAGCLFALPAGFITHDACVVCDHLVLLVGAVNEIALDVSNVMLFIIQLSNA